MKFVIVFFRLISHYFLKIVRNSNVLLIHNNSIGRVVIICKYSRANIFFLCYIKLSSCSLSRLLIMGLSMTAADLCSSFKQWEVQRSNVSIITEEFFQQVIQMIRNLVLQRSISLSLALWRL